MHPLRRRALSAIVLIATALAAAACGRTSTVEVSAGSLKNSLSLEKVGTASTTDGEASITGSKSATVVTVSGSTLSASDVAGSDTSASVDLGKPISSIRSTSAGNSIYIGAQLCDKIADGSTGDLQEPCESGPSIVVLTLSTGGSFSKPSHVSSGDYLVSLGRTKSATIVESLSGFMIQDGSSWNSLPAPPSGMRKTCVSPRGLLAIVLPANVPTTTMPSAHTDGRGAAVMALATDGNRTAWAPVKNAPADVENLSCSTGGAIMTSASGGKAKLWRSNGDRDDEFRLVRSFDGPATIQSATVGSDEYAKVLDLSHSQSVGDVVDLKTGQTVREITLGSGDDATRAFQDATFGRWKSDDVLMVAPANDEQFNRWAVGTVG